MATFLELCQKVARESGTVEGVKPATVDNQVGRAGLIVDWVREAWLEIQLTDDWRFNYTTFPLLSSRAFTPLTARQACYQGSYFGVDDFADWDFRNNVTLLDPAGNEGDDPRPRLIIESDEHLATQEIVNPSRLNWKQFERINYLGTVQARGKPATMNVNDQNELCFTPVPDQAYILQGSYRRQSQILGANGDIPRAPADWHDAIKWKAMMLLLEFDEADEGVRQRAKDNYHAYLGGMRRALRRAGGTPYIDNRATLAPRGNTNFFFDIDPTSIGATTGDTTGGG